MKNIHSFIAILYVSITCLTACDSEKQEPIIYDYGPAKTSLSIFIGQKDSCEYYSYNPEITLHPYDEFYGIFQQYHNLDFDDDNIIDMVVKRIQTIDTLEFEYFYEQTIKLWGTNNTEFITSHSHYYQIDTLHSGIEIHDSSNWSYEGDLITINQEINGNNISNTTCCGLWNIWDKDYYIGFRRTMPDTIIGWVRMELVTEGNLIKIKDCGIKRKGVEYD